MFISTTGEGRNVCGSSTTEWKAGWAAQNDCDCDQSRRCQNCNGYSSPSCDQAMVAV